MRLALTCSTAVTLVLLAGSAWAGRTKCPPDSVAVGPVCVDRYEASVWSVPPKNARLVGQIRDGKAGIDELAAGGAVQVGIIPMDSCQGNEYPATFPLTGNWTAPLYAASIAGVPPSTCITWFQAEQACRLSGKRLLTNEEWQAAAAGTPDPGLGDDGTTTCATNSDFAAVTGARSACVSTWGTHDMAGNVWEWVSGWVPVALACTSWDAAHGGDVSCSSVIPPAAPTTTTTSLAGQATLGVIGQEAVAFDANLPGAVIRGGNYATGTRNGIFAYFAGVNPTNISRSTGFRCAR